MGRTLVLLKDTFDTVLAKGGFPVSTGMVPFKAMVLACMNHTPDCQKAVAAINAETVAGTRIDASGKTAFPGVAPGTYYLMGSTFAAGQQLLWNVKVELRAGANSIVLDQRNATPVK